MTKDEPTPVPVVTDTMRRLRALAAGNGPTLAPYKDHSGFDQHDKLRVDLRELLAMQVPQPVVDSEVVEVLRLAVAIVDSADVEEVRGLAAALLAKLEKQS